MIGKGKIISIWGAPNTGKTSFTMKLATHLYDKFHRSCICVFTDMDTPVLPVLFPLEKEASFGSIGVPLSTPSLDDNLVFTHMVMEKGRENLGFLGYKAGENKNTYPGYSKGKAEELLESLQRLADYVLVDCCSQVKESMLSFTAIEKSHHLFRIQSPTIKCESFLLSNPYPEHLCGSTDILNVTDGDVALPVEMVLKRKKEGIFLLPFSHKLKEQMLTGSLHMPLKDNNYQKVLRQIAGKVIACESSTIL